jgi:predicted short-subunit dehydrogenase-like oxidoreductase (DUF2520 family)
MSSANVIIVAVRDPQIDSVMQDLLDIAAGRRLSTGTVVLHTSALAEPAALDALRVAGLSAGTFHPLIPFGDPEIAAELVRHGWIGVDGDVAAINCSRRLAGHLGARTLEIPAGRKPAYHAAAVISSNFPVVLASVATHLLRDIGVAEGSAHQAVESLMSGALANMKQALPDDALTGPVIRGDTETVGKHLRALATHGDAQEVYRSLSAAAVQIARYRGTDPKKLAALTGMLSPVARREKNQD